MDEHEAMARAREFICRQIKIEPCGKEGLSSYAVNLDNLFTFKVDRHPDKLQMDGGEYIGVSKTTGEVIPLSNCIG